MVDPSKAATGSCSCEDLGRSFGPHRAPRPRSCARPSPDPNGLNRKFEQSGPLDRHLYPIPRPGPFWVFGTGVTWPIRILRARPSRYPRGSLQYRARCGDSCGSRVDRATDLRDRRGLRLRPAAHAEPARPPRFWRAARVGARPCLRVVGCCRCGRTRPWIRGAADGRHIAWRRAASNGRHKPAIEVAGSGV
jgi:hypothetical protein